MPILKLLIVVAVLLCTSTGVFASEEDYDYAEIYKEVFGIDLVEEVLTGSAKVMVNGVNKDTIPISFQSISQEVILETELFKSLIDELVLDEKKEELYSSFNKDELSQAYLRSLGFIIRFSNISAELDIILPAKFSKEYIINLSPFKKRERNDLPSLQEASWISNYTNVVYRQSYSYIENEQTVNQLSYTGTASLPKVNVFYGGELGDSNNLSKFNVESDLPFVKGKAYLGTNLFDVNSNVNYFNSNFSYNFVGLKYQDISDKRHKFKKKRRITLKLDEETEIKIIVNGYQIYKKKHYPGQYKIENFNLKVGKNTVLIILQSSRLETIEKTMYHIDSFAPGKFDLSLASGYSYAGYDFSAAEYEPENFYSNAKLSMGLTNFASTSIETIVAKEKLYQVYSLDMASKFAISQSSLAKDFTTEQNKSALITDHYIYWYIPEFVKWTFLSRMSTQLTYRTKTFDGVDYEVAKKAIDQNFIFSGDWLTTSVGYNRSSDSNEFAVGVKGLVQDYDISSESKYDLNSKKLTLGVDAKKTYFGVLDLKSSVSYTKSSETSSWAFSLIGEYAFDILGNKLKPVAGISADSSGNAAPSYGLSHSLETKYNQADVSMKTTVLQDSLSSTIGYRDGYKSIQYELSEEDDELSQSLLYTDEYLKLSFIESDSIMRTSATTAFAFTSNQFGVARSISDGFSLYKADDSLPKSTKITAKTTSFGRLSAVGGPPSYTNDYDVMNYHSITINGNKQLSEDKFYIKPEKHKGYSFIVSKPLTLEFKATLVDRRSGELIVLDEYVSVFKQDAQEEPIYAFMTEPGKITVTDASLTRYVITVPGYKPAYIDLNDFAHMSNESINIGKVRMEARRHK